MAIGISLACCLLLIVLVLLPAFIAKRRGVYHMLAIRTMALVGFLLPLLGVSGWGFGRFIRSRPVWAACALLLGLLLGTGLWLAALIWACIGRPRQTSQGFDVIPLARLAPPDQSGTSQH